MDSTREERFRYCRHSDQGGLLLLCQDEFSILSDDHLNLTYIYNPLSADSTLARHVVHKLQRWALKTSVFYYRMEHVMDELSYWTDLMKIWEVGWIAGSENKAHGKMASLFAQPYISPPDYDTVEFPSKWIFYWRSRALSMSTSVVSKETRRFVKKYRRSKSMLVA
jgi:hypothetical protein